VSFAAGGPPEEELIPVVEAICQERGDYMVSLKLGKTYEVQEVPGTDKVRVWDESGHCYLYPAKWFLRVD
jgi:hypothetical protein